MKKILVILFFICVSGFSQDFQGKAYYMSKVNLNMDWMKNMPPDRQAYMKGRMKSATEKNYTLEFDSNSSYFQEEERLDPNGQGGGFNWMQFVTGPAMGTIHRDIQSNTYTNKKELFGKIFLVKDSIPEIKWVMTGETKKRLTTAVLDAAQRGNAKLEYEYMPAQLKEPYISRKRAVGYALYELYGIKRDDYPA